MKEVAFSNPASKQRRTRQYYMAAALVRNKHVVKIRSHSNKTSPRAARLNRETNEIYLCLHAEVSVLNLATSKDEVHVYRWTKGNEPRVSKPCTYCMQALYESNVKRVHYFNENNEHESCNPYSTGAVRGKNYARLFL